MMVARLEAQCIVFVAEGLLLTHESNPTAEFELKEDSECFENLSMNGFC